MIATGALNAAHEHVAPPGWIKSLSVVSIPWAISIHTVTAFLYSGLPGRTYWLTAILAPRFLASAFASGPALLILLCVAIRKLNAFDVGREAIHKLSVIVAYATAINIFFLLAEVFTAFYSEIPEHEDRLPISFRRSGWRPSPGALDVAFLPAFAYSVDVAAGAEMERRHAFPGDGMPVRFFLDLA